ncbi:MAG: ROK family protein [Daejeonella sp.]
MPVLGIDLGGTKIAAALFSAAGDMISKESVALHGKKGSEVGGLVTELVEKFLRTSAESGITAIGVCVPGISRISSGTVWAPNIPGWDDYPLLKELQDVCGSIPVVIDSDRACYILGENWKGAAKGCSDAIYLSVGTGIGAGILINDTILRGAHDIAGCIGWMALDGPFKDKYIPCGCFEYHASGEGIAKVCRELLQETTEYNGILSDKALDDITAADVFSAYDQGDGIAREVMDQCIRFWGMAIANLISLFNPEKIIMGGGVFGPAARFIPEIKAEADKWAQPISVTQVSIEHSRLGGDAGVYGAAYLALKSIKPIDK